MQHVDSSTRFGAPASEPASPSAARRARSFLPPPRWWEIREQAWSEMRRAFRTTGGVVTADALLVVLRSHSDQPLSLLAKWIVNREVVNFEAGGDIWLPMFQFEPGGAGVKAVVRKVILELCDVFDDWELTEWFASSNSWLADRSPAVSLAIDPDAVLQAARADRFVAVG